MNYKLMNKNIEVLDFSYDHETHTITKITKISHSEYAPLGMVEKFLLLEVDLKKQWQK